MARESKSAAPATPIKGGASRATDRDAANTSTRIATIGERSSTPPTEAKAESREEAVLSAGSRGVARPLSRNLADELSAVAGPDAADDDWGEEEKEDEPSSKAVHDSDGLALSVKPDAQRVVASEAGADLHKWKKKLRAAFGVKDISKGNSRCHVRRFKQPIWRWFCYRKPLRRLTKVPETSATIFSKGEESPYFQDSHMVTPRSASRARRLADDCDGSHADSDYDFWDQVDEDPREELVRQMDALCATNTSDSGPRLELASHIPLDPSNSSADVATRTALSIGTDSSEVDRRKWKLLSQAFIDYYCTQYKQSPAARYYAATRERKEHISDYLNCLNGYARNARLQVEKGQRDAKDHVEQFLLTCGDDAARLCRILVGCA
ncbi:hypothetical protein GQ600_8516 [Phytophthora cactorum]|nr:hypothetical protein GQ600_8516 [Phytophthora cactorum]